MLKDTTYFSFEKAIDKNFGTGELVMLDVESVTYIDINAAKSMLFQDAISNESHALDIANLLLSIEYITIILYDLNDVVHATLPQRYQIDFNKLFLITFYEDAPKNRNGKPIPAKRTSSLIRSRNSIRSHSPVDISDD
jgi:hypothetical protein